MARAFLLVDRPSCILPFQDFHNSFISLELDIFHLQSLIFSPVASLVRLYECYTASPTQYTGMALQTFVAAVHLAIKYGRYFVFDHKQRPF